MNLVQQRISYVRTVLILEEIYENHFTVLFIRYFYLRLNISGASMQVKGEMYKGPTTVWVASLDCSALTSRWRCPLVPPRERANRKQSGRNLQCSRQLSRRKTKKSSKLLHSRFCRTYAIPPRSQHPTSMMKKPLLAPILAPHQLKIRIRGLILQTPSRNSNGHISVSMKWTENKLQ